ncbi:MAG: hypothetical protein HY364_04345 [Candidatus Aenigmarchaeota archaeon]|nr:hypothetical protein [Candidatus Aenigmarchaeota archaeon]
MTEKHAQALKTLNKEKQYSFIQRICISDVI